MENKIKMDAAGVLIKAAREGTRDPFQYFHYDFPAFSMTALGTSQQTIQTFSDSYFVVKGMAAVAYASNAVATRTFTVSMLNGATGQTLNDFALNNANVFGSFGAGAYPNRLVDPIILPPSSNLIFTLVDTANNGTYSLQISLLGFRVFDLGNPPVNVRDGARLQWFCYSASQTLAANGGPTPITTRIAADADFLVRKIVATSTGLYQAQISDAANGDTWTKTIEPGQLFAGTAQYPNLLAKPRLIRRNSALLTYMQDLSNAQNAIQIVYEGAKIYR